MPVISRFFGIIIYMYWNDHAPPHFHAKYGEYEITVNILDGVVEGRFPRRALRLVVEWYEVNQDALRRNWELCRQREMPEPIASLE